MMFPPLPEWPAVHPLVVHFPIALLLIAPLFVVIGALRKPGRGYPFMLSALLVMVLGTVSIYVAASSGQAARCQARNTPLIQAVLDEHEELAESTEMAFTVLTLIFASIVFLPRAFKQNPNSATSTVLPLVFLVFYAAGAVSLANSAHQGGRLVHELGVTAHLPRPLITPAVAR
jgi:uncharacterized membrane protein